MQRGNLKKAIELFDKAIPLANTELEMVRIEIQLYWTWTLWVSKPSYSNDLQGHLFGLRDAAMAQITVSAKLGISLPPMGMMG